MKYSINLISIGKALLTVIGVNILIVIVLFSLGNYFHILHSFSWFGYKIIVLPLSFFVFVLSVISQIKVKQKNVGVSNEDEEIEYKSRMEKYHDS